MPSHSAYLKTSIFILNLIKIFDYTLVAKWTDMFFIKISPNLTSSDAIIVSTEPAIYFSYF